MNWFINLTTRAKLLLCFGLILLFLATVVFFAYTGIKSIEESQKRLFQREFTTALTCGELRADLNRQRARMLQMMLTTDRNEQGALQADIRSRANEIDESIQKISEGLAEAPKSIAKLEELKRIVVDYRSTREKEFSLIQEGKIEEAKQLGNALQEQRFERIRAIALDLADQAGQRAGAAVQQAERKTRQSIRIFLIVGLGALLVGIILAISMNRIIATPLKEISGVAERVASGDLTLNLPSNERKDEVGALAHTFSSMVRSLAQATKEITEGVTILGSSASEILASTTQVAAGASETATAVSETVTTVEEVKQTAQVSSQKARYVSESAQKAAQISQAGKQSVDQSIEAMNRIREQMESVAASIVRLSEQSQSIGEIIATVNDLAEQSNLLAVNAAIEAAKAGEQGKGFSVVAQEVKSMAEQSKQSTSQIRNILGEVQKAISTAVMATEQGTKAVDLGVKQSTEAGDSIRKLAESITESAQAAAQIAASSQQQLVGMDQVAQAMENIKLASSQNVAGAKQVEVAAQNLNQLGKKLKELVEQYQV